MATFQDRRCTSLTGGGTWSVPLCTDKTLKGYLVEYTAPVRGQFGASYYELVTTKLYWSGALKVASSYSYRNKPGHLVTVDSAAEDAFIASLISNTWLGGTVDDTMSWKWMAGPEAGTAFWDASAGGVGSTSGGYVNWAATQPLSLGDGQKVHPYIVLVTCHALIPTNESLSRPVGCETKHLRMSIFLSVCVVFALVLSISLFLSLSLSLSLCICSQTVFTR